MPTPQNGARRRTKPLAILMAMLLLVGCGGDGSITDVPEEKTVAAIVIDGEVTVIEMTAVNQTVTLTAKAMDAANQPLSGIVFVWSSSDQAVATVNASGVVTALKNGTAMITATAQGKSGTRTIKVTQTVASVAIPGSGDVQLASLNQTATLSAEARDAGGAAVTGVTFGWSSSDESVATVSSAGVVTARKNGTATITASASGKSAARNVVVSQAAASLSMSPSPIPNLQVGDSVQLSATVLDAGGSAIAGAGVAWSVAPAAAGTFTAPSAATTWFKAGSAGGATVAAASGGRTVTANVTIAAPSVSSVTILGTGNVQFASLNQTATLTAEARDAQGQVMSGVTFSWSSSDANVASVSSTGDVTARRNGSTTITASAGGKSGTRGVVVSQVAASVSITPAPLPDMNVGDSVQVTATVKDAGGSDIADAAVAWSVAPTNAGTFTSSSAKAPWFKATTASNATVTVTSGGKSASAAVKINSSSSSAQGSLAFTYSGSRSGSFSATGTPIWDSSGFLYGTYAGALYDAQGYDEYTLGGFIARGNNKADGFMITLIGVTGPRNGIPICSGVYDQCPSSGPAATLGALMFYGEWTTDGLESSDPNSTWLMTSGTVNVTELTATRIKGTFSGIAVRAIDGAGSMPMANGTFDLPIVN